MQSRQLIDHVKFHEQLQLLSTEANQSQLFRKIDVAV